MASTTRDPLFVQKIQESNEQLGKETRLVVCIEELAELLQVLSKFYREKGDRLNLIEELGDLLICVEAMRQFYGISEEELKEKFMCARVFVVERKTQSSTKNSIFSFMKEVIEILLR